MRNTLKEHMFSAVAPATDIAQQGQHVRTVPEAVMEALFDHVSGET